VTKRERLDAVIAILLARGLTIKKIVRPRGDDVDPEILLIDKRVIQVGLRSIMLYGVPTRRGVIGSLLQTFSHPHELSNYLLPTP